MKRALAGIAIAAASICGCSYGYDVTTHVTLINQLNLPKHPSPVDVFFGETQPECGYVQLAFIEVTGFKYAETDTLLSVLKNQARDLGADAVIFVDIRYTERGRGEALTTFFYQVSDHKNVEDKYPAPFLTAVAIKYK